ncbi:MAG: hypothetical protein AAGK97_18275, partial [Bacteroidota bacterium]
MAETDLIEIICEGDSIQVGDTAYATTGMFSDTLTSNVGCDSIVNLDLTVIPNDVTNLVEVICEGENFNGYDMTGMYSDTIPGSDGCDSIINLDLTVIQNDTTDLIEIICQGDSIVIGDSIFNADGNYTVILINQNNCDSIVNLDLTITPSTPIEIFESLCPGESVTYGGVVYSSSGTFYDTTSTSEGCDSITIINIDVGPITYQDTSVSICQGETYSHSDGTTYSNTGAYELMYTNAAGCDSLYIIYLFVNPTFDSTTFVTICDGSVYNFEGTDYSTTGVFSVTYTSQNGCDSILNLDLNVLPANDPACESLCDGSVEIVD